MPPYRNGSKTMEDAIDPRLLEDYEAQHGYYPDPYAE